MKSVGGLLSVFNNEDKTLPSTDLNLEIDKTKVSKLATISKEVEQILKKCGNMSPQIKQKTYKKLKNGIYVGPLNSSNEPEGYGRIRYQDNSIFYGNFQDGKAHGKGLVIYDNQTYYYGDFNESNFQGNGQYYSKDYNFKGQLSQNKFHGKGVIEFKQKNGKFEGQFQKGQMKQGVLTWQIENKNSKKPVSKFRYKGKFKNNKFQDLKAQLSSSIGLYKGSFIDGSKEGKGTFQFNEKYQYIGQYSKNLKSGNGTLYNPMQIERDGKKYSELSTDEKDISYRGTFKNNMPHGLGAIYNQQTKKLMEAQYEDGIWVKILPKKSGK